MELKTRLSKLLTVKSIVTIIMTAVIAYLSIAGRVEIKDVYLIIIGFYFGTQKVKE